MPFAGCVWEVILMLPSNIPGEKYLWNLLLRFTLGDCYLQGGSNKTGGHVQVEVNMTSKRTSRLLLS